jgi:galactokinase
VSQFAEVFGYAPEVTASAPGRVNLLGEHTDYNDGFVLPTPIPRVTQVAVARSRSRSHHLHSAQLRATVSYPEGDPPRGGFAPYIEGCMQVVRERGHAIPPLAVHIDSRVPIGAGLSSSAALEVATLRALRILVGASFDDVELARMAQQAELQYANVRCGIMDQMASSLGRLDQMLFLDTRALEWRLIPLPPESALMVFDSGVPRQLAASAYNDRRRECERAAGLLGVKALRDVTEPARAAELPPPLERRARHVISENRRVLEAAAGVSAASFGTLMNDSHASLRDDFEVSIPALDRLVDILQQHPRVFGARLTGAGFGGACVALVATGAGESIKGTVLDQYAGEGYRGSLLV